MKSQSQSQSQSQSSTDLSFEFRHSSYIQGRSAPSTPGILGRSSSRRHLGAGLSRKLSIYDNDPSRYAAVEVNRDGVPLNAVRPDAAMGAMPKAKSEAALVAQRRNLSKMQMQLPAGSGPASSHSHQQHQQQQQRQHPYSQASKDDDWLTRAGLATTSMLRESKGQSWLVSRDSSTSLLADENASDNDGNDNDGYELLDDSMMRNLNSPSHQRLHFGDDELSPETPRAMSRWGSRFGSRTTSARNSRRGSRAELDHLPTLVASRQEDYFTAMSKAAEYESTVEPDFVDPPDAMFASETDAEQEIARLAKERSFGFGGVVDRLVGWSLFSVDEDRDATDVEDDDAVGTKGTDEGTDGTSSLARRARQRHADAQMQSSQEPQAERRDEDKGAWSDAAWLLSVASKVIL